MWINRLRSLLATVSPFLSRRFYYLLTLSIFYILSRSWLIYDENEGLLLMRDGIVWRCLLAMAAPFKGPKCGILIFLSRVIEC